MKKLVETQSNEKMSEPIYIIKGIVTAYLLTFILLFLFSICLTYTNLSEITIAPVIIVITIISILIGSSIASTKIKKNGIINGGIVGVIYILILYLISSIVQVGFAFNVYALVMVILSVLAGMVGGIVRSKLEKIIDKVKMV